MALKKLGTCLVWNGNFLPDGKKEYVSLDEARLLGEVCVSANIGKEPLENLGSWKLAESDRIEFISLINEYREKFDFIYIKAVN